jgi:hypothetical protein
VKLSVKLLLILFITAIYFVIILDFGSPISCVWAKKENQNKMDLESNQSFSGDVGSIIEYNVYIENRGKSVASYMITGSSSTNFYIEVWRDVDQIGSGDIQLIPTQDSTITLNAGEVATLVVKVTIPFDAAEGTTENTTIRAEDTKSGASDSVSLVTIVDTNLPYPSSWIQLGSDPYFPTPPPERIDIKAFYYTNNGSDVFFRMAEAGKPDTRSFVYSVYLDTKSGGQQIEDYNYDYLLSSDGFLYEWTGNDWTATDQSVYCVIDGSTIVLWTNLDAINMENQEIHILDVTTTKAGVLKDKMGPYQILKNNISEIPWILLPLLSFAIYFTLSRRREKHPNTN